MSFFEFIIALVVLNYLYKIINGDGINKNKQKEIILNELKPLLRNINNEYKEWHDQFLTEILNADGNIEKIVSASKVIEDKIKERENEIIELDLSNLNKQKKSK